jgi:hypothetical protein
MVGLVANAQASSGLRVFVYVHNAGEYIGKEASVTVNTSQDYDKYKEVIVPQADFYVEFQYDEGVVAVGDEIAGCANIYGTNVDGCASTWNSEDKKPERIDIYLESRP